MRDKKTIEISTKEELKTFVEDSKEEGNVGILITEEVLSLAFEENLVYSIKLSKDLMRARNCSTRCISCPKTNV